MPSAPVPALTGQTRPEYYNMLSTGIGVVPRRGWDIATAFWLSQAEQNPIGGMMLWARTAPARLLTVMS
jgi:hypothetical protein